MIIIIVHVNKIKDKKNIQKSKKETHYRPIDFLIQRCNKQWYYLKPGTLSLSD